MDTNGKDASALSISKDLRTRTDKMTSLPGVIAHAHGLAGRPDDARIILENEMRTGFVSLLDRARPSTWALIAVILLDDRTRPMALPVVAALSLPDHALFAIGRLIDALVPEDRSEAAETLRSRALSLTDRNETADWCRLLDVQPEDPLNWSISIRQDGPVRLLMDIHPHPSGWKIVVATPSGRSSFSNGVTLQNDLELPRIERLEHLPAWLASLSTIDQKLVFDRLVISCSGSRKAGKLVKDWLRP